MVSPIFADTSNLDPSGDKDVAIVSPIVLHEDVKPSATLSAPLQKIVKEKIVDAQIAPIITTSAAPKETQTIANSNKPGSVSNKPIDLTDDSRPAQIVSNIAESHTPEAADKAQKPALKIASSPIAAKVEAPVAPKIIEKPAPVIAKSEIKPVFKVAPAKIVVSTVEKPATETPDSPVISKKSTSALIVAKAIIPDAKKDVPAVTPVSPEPLPAQAVKEIPKPDSNMVTQVIMDVPGVPMPATRLNPVPKEIVASSKPIIVPPIKSQEREENILTTPPKVMAENPTVKAATTKPVSFPISSKSKTRGDIDPSSLVEAKTPLAPQPATKKAAMQDDLAPVVALSEATKNAGPEVIYRNVPTPKPRPNVIVASKEFVERARRTYEETYTVLKRDGDKMPAVQNQKVAKEELPQGKIAPARISVADIAGDPLASKLVSMTPDDIASALNGITPAAGGNSSRTTEVDEVRTGQRIRIVRENGNWTPRKPVDAAQQTASMNDLGNSPTAKPDADGRYNIAFKTGATDLPATLFGEVDSGVVSALKSDSNTRVQIVAYASAQDGKDTTAKRTSLARALSLRSYLISKGIDATRMDVRAMGMQKDAKAESDQVEMILLPAGKG